MQTYRLKVDPDGRVTIPNAKPGETIVVQVDAPSKDDHLTFATARTPEEKEQVIEEILALASQLRAQMDPDSTFSENDLYDANGLPA